MHSTIRIKPSTALFVGWLLIFALLAMDRAASAGVVLFAEDWESGPGEWTADGGVWQLGAPSVGPAAAHAGASCAFVQSYPANANTRWIGPDPIASYGWALPADPLDGQLWLRLWQWYDVEWSDHGQLEISRDGGPWEALPESEVTGHGGGVWSQALYDLSAYKGSRVRIAFHFVSSAYYEWTGWYVDDLRIEEGALQIDFPLTFEAGTADLSAQQGCWEVGTPTEGPARAHGGASCAGVVLGGAYPAGALARLIVPEFQLPPVVEGGLWLRFWQWYDIEWSDSGLVEISRDGAAWEELPESIAVGHGGGIWTHTAYDLSAYAGSRIRIAFRFASSSYYEWSGWYIDDVTIHAGALALNNPEDFDSGFANWFQQKDGWSVRGGTWQIGRPEGGPGVAHSGSECAGTVLNAAYPAGTDARLISPTYVLPVTLAGGQAWLTYWQWFDIEWSDLGVVEVSRDGGPWEVQSATQVTGHGGAAWTQAACDLSQYAGSSIRIAFRLASSSYYEWSGWYLDDIGVVEGPLTHRGSVDGFEEGPGSWATEGGTWEIGTPYPAVGPGAAYAGTRCAATVLEGAYPAGSVARLVSPQFVLTRLHAAQPIRLKFRHWFSFGPGDQGVVAVRVVGGDWLPLTTYTGTGGGVWSAAQADLTAYEGSTVQVGFQLMSDSYYEWEGWYLDEIELTNIDLTRPASPVNLVVDYGVDPSGLEPPVTRPMLEWNPVADPNLAAYAVYRGRGEDFTPDLAARVALTTSLTYTDMEAHGASFHYKVSAIDTEGNESLASLPSSVTAAPPSTAGPETPGRVVLEGNYPNPFNPTTTIRFSVPSPQHVELGIYDLRGRLVRRLLSDQVEGGVHDVVLHADGLASGIYVYRLQTAAGIAARTMTLVK